MITALRTESDGRAYWTAIGALIVSAWLALAWLGTVPFVDHARVHLRTLPSERSAALDPQQVFGLQSRRASGNPLRQVSQLAVFVGGWTLMTVAMMLPTSLPLVTLFRMTVRRRPDGTLLLFSLIFGYLAIWTAFGVAVHAVARGLEALITTTHVLSTHGGHIGAGVLLLAGVYQFTPLKDRCLEACRSPLIFLAENWRGGGRLSAVRLGLRHGVFCLGCCWTLMLLMVFVGGANLGWMLALGAVMAAEKAAPWGRRLVMPLGMMLLIAGTMMALSSVGSVL